MEATMNNWTMSTHQKTIATASYQCNYYLVGERLLDPKMLDIAKEAKILNVYLKTYLLMLSLIQLLGKHSEDEFGT